MKTKIWIMVGVLIIAFATMAVPVMAGETGTAAITGDVPTSVDIVLNQSSITLDLSQATATNTTLGITATTNCPFAIRVNDAYSDSKNSNAGYLANYTTAYMTAASGLDTHLTNPLGFQGISNGAVTGIAASTPISNSGESNNIFTGTAATGSSGTELATTATQTGANLDMHLPTGSTYRIDLLFTIYAA
jgi:hypothetical protein